MVAFLREEQEWGGAYLCHKKGGVLKVGCGLRLRESRLGGWAFVSISTCSRYVALWGRMGAGGAGGGGHM